MGATRLPLLPILFIAGILLPAMTAAEPSAGDLTADSVIESQEASVFIRQLADDTIASLDTTEEGSTADRSRIERLMQQGFEIELISRYVLGRHWRKATEEQRSEYVLLFEDFVLDVILNRVSAFTSEELEVTGQIPAGKRDIFVKSVVHRQGGDIDVDWRVRKIGEDYRIVDIKVAGVSMVITYREDFGSVIQTKGLDGLLERLREKSLEHPDFQNLENA